MNKKPGMLIRKKIVMAAREVTIVDVVTLVDAPMHQGRRKNLH
jgi:hypothetical protein